MLALLIVGFPTPGPPRRRGNSPGSTFDTLYRAGFAARNQAWTRLGRKCAGAADL